MSLGGVLLVGAGESWLQWVLVVGAILAVLFSRFSYRSRSFEVACAGANLVCIARDFAVPLDAVLFGILPLCAVRWKAREAWVVLLAAALVECLIRSVTNSAITSIPREDWTPPLLAALFVASGETLWERLGRAGLVLLRHVWPRAAWLLYGASFVVLDCQTVFFDDVAGRILLVTGFAILARAQWAHWALAAFGLVCYIRDAGLG